MKVDFLLFGLSLALFALVVVGVIAATATYAQPPQQSTTSTAAKPAQVNSAASAGAPRGPVGGPVNKGAKINGTGMQPKH
ncbi:MAG: hypothetical protein ACLQJR_07930 [Stellaceae bacterium]